MLRITQNAPDCQFADQFVLERYAVVTMPGISLFDSQPLPREDVRFLLETVHFDGQLALNCLKNR